MLVIQNTVMILVDIQEKLAGQMVRKDVLIDNLKRMISGARVLNIPVIVTEQVPDKLGGTISELQTMLIDSTTIAKTSFSCWGEDQFRDVIREINRPHVIIAGIETHVCIYQTVSDLLAAGYEVHVVDDAVSSRYHRNHEIGIARSSQEGAVITSVEMALFELVKVAEGKSFKEVIKIVR